VTEQLRFRDMLEGSRTEYATLDELESKLKAIKNMGYVRSVYLHAGGVGNTLESLLGVKENNLTLPDLGAFELKARRKETGSMITLFTKSPNRYSNAKLLRDYGYPSGGKLKIHQTVCRDVPNAKGYLLKETRDEIQCWNLDNCLGTYSLEFLRRKFLEKIGDGVILALARTRKRSDGWEEFNYQDAFLLKGANFDELMRNLNYDIRIGRYPDGRVHDHGSAFRLRFADLEKVFRVYRKLL
jgi:hypothetical protein